MGRELRHLQLLFLFEVENNKERKGFFFGKKKSGIRFERDDDERDCIEGRQRCKDKSTKTKTTATEGKNENTTKQSRQLYE